MTSTPCLLAKAIPNYIPAPLFLVSLSFPPDGAPDMNVVGSNKKSGHIYEDRKWPSSLQSFLSETKVHGRQDEVSKISLSSSVGFELGLCPCSLRRKDL